MIVVMLWYMFFFRTSQKQDLESHETVFILVTEDTICANDKNTTDQIVRFQTKP